MKNATIHILVTGSSGYLGQHLLSSLDSDKKSYSYDVTAAYGSLDSFKDAATPFRKVQVDLQDKSSINALFNSIPPVDILVHLAAMSSPAQCEKYQMKCFAVNSPKLFLDALPSSCKDVIFLSTDQVYNGDPKLAPFKETDDAIPVNFYGKSKLEFESELMKLYEKSVLSRVVILRSSLMLGPVAPLGACRKQSFLQFIQNRLSNGQATDFYSDEIRCVVHVSDVVRVINHSIFNKDHQSGVYNLGGADRVSRIDLALAVARYLGLDESLAKSVKRFDTCKEGGVPSPPDISVQMNKLKSCTGIETMGLDEIVKSSFA